MDNDDFRKTFSSAEVELQGRGTPAERLQNVAKAFSDLALAGDEDAAKIILARLEGRDPEDGEALAGLDANKVSIVAEGIAKIRRGDTWDLVTTAAAAGAGVALGYASHRLIDARPAGIPLNAAAGALGLAAGSMLDTTLTTRNAFFTGGAMFSLGSLAYTLTHPKVGDG